VAREINRLTLKTYAESPVTEEKTVGTYNRQVWRIMRELFLSEIDEYAFVDDFSAFIDNQFTRAWNQGAREMGVNPNQFTMNDIAQLANRIAAERDHMLQLADDIMVARAQKIDLATFRARFQMRAEMYANRYNDILNEARVWFGGKELLEWVVGQTEHCADCLRLNGVVAPANEWMQYPLRPQCRELECQGYRCQCQLLPTDKKPTEGGIPR
jgi:hypothetical protein